MVKLTRLLDFMNQDTLRRDILAAEKLLKKGVVADRSKTAVLEGVKNNVIATAEGLFSEALYEKVEEHKMLNGERPVEGFEDWDAGIDEACENATAPYIDVLSHNWLGSFTIDTQLHQEGAVERIVASFAREVYKQITHGVSGDDILKASGVDLDVYEKLFASPAVQNANAAEDKNAFKDFVRIVAARYAGDYDPIYLYDFLDNAVDSDDGLSFGAVSQLVGAEPGQDVTPYSRALQNFRKLNGKDAPQRLLDLVVAKMSAPNEVEEDFTDELTEPQVEAVAELPKADKVEIHLPKDAGKAKARKPKAEEEKSVYIIPPGVLKDLQDALGNDDTKMAAIIGVSRQSWSNYATGKREFTPSTDQKLKMREALNERENAIQSMKGRV